jgi:site-specific DNA-methyltransferase (adenine-specific)
MSQQYLGGKVTLHGGDNREVLKEIPDNSIDSIVTDPPYALVSISKRFGKVGNAPVVVPEGGSGAYARASRGFMGKSWDTGEVAFAVEFWGQIYRVLKPGGHVVSFSGTRTYHRIACAIEDAGFEIRDCLQWLYGSGFPKSYNVGKGIDSANGDVRPVVGSRAAHNITGGNLMGASQGVDGGKHTINLTSAASAAWEGWGTALKPAVEPICLARKPLIGTVVENVLKHGTGALNIDGTRIGTRTAPTGEIISDNGSMSGPNYGRVKTGEQTIGRWPANVIHDGSDEVVSGFPDTKSSRSDITSRSGAISVNGTGLPPCTGIYGFDDSGSAARFFYSAKADSEDRAGSKHPTIKPVDLMQWLCRLITPPNGTILDPFAGSGSTGEAAWREGFNCILIEREAEYLVDIDRRLTLANQGPVAREHSRMVARGKVDSHDSMPLFGGGAAQ